MKRIKPTSRRLLSLEVVRSERMSEHFQVVTLGGEDLVDFTSLGGDQAFRLLFRGPGQDRVRLPTSSGSGWMAEVPSTGDIPEVHTSSNVTVHWLPRDGQHEIPGRYALEAVKASDLPAGRFATFVAGESKLPTALRRHLTAERAAAKSDITFIGYWRHGKASPG